MVSRRTHQNEIVTKNPRKKLGLYCHVPFCAHQCDYCAFYKEEPTAQKIKRYLECIEAEMKLLNIETPFDTIYIGGGTPGVLTANSFEHLCSSLTQNNISREIEEFSVEFSPSTVQKEKISVLMNFGCNRITLGVQSFNEKTMKSLGRRQTLNQVLKAYESIRICGIQNIGIDLIFCVPGQTHQEWLEDLRIAVDLQPQHISTYNLTFEKDTKLTKYLEDNNISKKTDDEEADFFIETRDFLCRNGYRQYEVSNYCRPGFESKHNLNTWKMNDWIGIGPSACSQYMSKRFSNSCSLEKWESNIGNNMLSHENIIDVTDKQMAEDSIIFGLRMTDGIDLDEINANFPKINVNIIKKFFDSLKENKLAKINNSHVALTSKGLLVADAISVEILNIMSK